MTGKSYESCSLHDSLMEDVKEIKDDVKTLLITLGGKRIERLEVIVYGACAAALVAVVAAVLALVIQS